MSINGVSDAEKTHFIVENQLFVLTKNSRKQDIKVENKPIESETAMSAPRSHKVKCHSHKEGV
jgi:hypothetical protein